MTKRRRAGGGTLVEQRMDETSGALGDRSADRALCGRIRWKRPMLRPCASALTSLFLLASLAETAQAAPEPSAKLVRCGASSCLRISGYRENAAAVVRVNGHAVPAEGRSEERRVGHECVSTGRSRGSTYH